MDRVFSAGYMADQFSPPAPAKTPSSPSARKSSSKMNRSESEWAFQRFIQEASAVSQPSVHLDVPTSCSPSSSESSSKPANDVSGVKDGEVAEMNSFSGSPTLLSADSDDYHAFLKKRLSLACAAVALTRGSVGKPQNPASQAFSASQLEYLSPSQDSGDDLTGFQDKKLGGPPTKKKPETEMARTVSGSSMGLSCVDEAEREVETIEHVGTAVAKRSRRMVSNRESARRSRRRKQTQMSELEAEVSQLRDENSCLSERLNELSHKYKEAAVDNRVLKADVETLKAKVEMAEVMVRRVAGLNTGCPAMVKAAGHGTKQPPQFYGQPAPVTICGMAGDSSGRNTGKHHEEGEAVAATGENHGRVSCRPGAAADAESC